MNINALARIIPLDRGAWYATAYGVSKRVEHSEHFDRGSLKTSMIEISLSEWRIWGCGRRWLQRDIKALVGWWKYSISLVDCGSDFMTVNILKIYQMVHVHLNRVNYYLRICINKTCPKHQVDHINILATAIFGSTYQEVQMCALFCYPWFICGFAHFYAHFYSIKVLWWLWNHLRNFMLKSTEGRWRKDFYVIWKWLVKRIYSITSPAAT